MYVINECVHSFCEGKYTLKTYCRELKFGSASVKSKDSEQVSGCCSTSVPQSYEQNCAVINI